MYVSGVYAMCPFLYAITTNARSPDQKARASCCVFSSDRARLQVAALVFNEHLLLMHGYSRPTDEPRRVDAWAQAADVHL